MTVDHEIATRCALKLAEFTHAQMGSILEGLTLAITDTRKAKLAPELNADYEREDRQHRYRMLRAYRREAQLVARLLEFAR